MMRVRHTGCVTLVLLSLVPFWLHAVSSSGSLAVSAYKEEGSTDTFVKIRAYNLSGNMLGPGLALDLGDGSGWMESSLSDAFYIKVSGTYMHRVDVRLVFSRFRSAESVSGGYCYVDGQAGFGSVDSDYGTKQFQISNRNYYYKDFWPQAQTEGTISLDGGVLAVSGEIKRKRTTQGDASYTNLNIFDSIDIYTRTAFIRLKIDSASYASAWADTEFLATVTIECLVQ